MAHERYLFSFTSWLLFVIFLGDGLKVQPQASVKQYRFHKLASTLILEPITGQLSHYVPLSHFASRYAINFKQLNILRETSYSREIQDRPVSFRLFMGKIGYIIFSFCLQFCSQLNNDTLLYLKNDFKFINSKVTFPRFEEILSYTKCRKIFEVFLPVFQHYA